MTTISNILKNPSNLINTVAAAVALSTDDVQAMSGPDLVRVYNLLTEGEEVKRFATRADGVKRVTKLVAAAREAVKPKTDVRTAVAKAIVKMGGIVTAPDLAHLNGHAATSGTIRLLAKTNPKRPGSAAHARFQFYRDGMTVADYLTAGGQRLDLRYDADHGFIRVEK